MLKFFWTELGAENNFAMLLLTNSAKISTFFSIKSTMSRNHCIFNGNIYPVCPPLERSRSIMAMFFAPCSSLSNKCELLEGSHPVLEYLLLCGACGVSQQVRDVLKECPHCLRRDRLLLGLHTVCGDKLS